MKELWHEMAERFATVDSERMFHLACKLAGIGLREMLERGTLDDEVSRQMLETSHHGNPRLADFSLRAAWFAFADRIIRDATVPELEPAESGSYIGVSDFARDWPIIKETYRSVCMKMARQDRQPNVEPDPLFALYNRAKKAAGKKHRSVTDTHVAEAYFDSLDKAEVSKLLSDGETRASLIAQYVTKLRNCRKNHPGRLWSPGS